MHQLQKTVKQKRCYQKACDLHFPLLLTNIDFIDCSPRKIKFTEIRTFGKYLKVRGTVRDIHAEAQHCGTGNFGYGLHQ